ncbi:rod shape-determining protein [Nonomuraea sp. SBT364]|uniref:rod shape-determining protein n=1 Tax=Nonomuraea sp. SBT364 TaxID=1580530 RepID=UPI00066D35E2|nr:rod shape-determining protein [Nonomuraea sp. SBT364]
MERPLGRDLAVDLGTASTQIHARGRGIVLNEPSAVARDPETGRAVRFGTQALEGGGTCWPVRAGMPGDLELARLLVRHFVRRVHRFTRPRLVMALPDGCSPVVARTLSDLAYEADARGVVLVPHALAVALGAGVTLDEPAGTMVVDIGPGLTRIAVLAGGEVVAATSTGVGGDDMNRAIARLIEREHGLLIGGREAEAVKRHAGTAWKPLDRQVLVHGRDPETGRERVVPIAVHELYEATRQPVDAIVRAAVRAVAHCPAELAADLGERGATLAGGGSLLRGLGRRLSTAMGIPVRRAEQPVETVALGLARYVDRRLLP